MSLRVSFPQDWRPERRWIGEVLLGEFLGLEHELAFGEGATVCIRAEGKTLAVADAFFRDTRTCPGSPRRWTVAASGLEARLLEPEVPVIFGEPGFAVEGNDALLSLDVFGTAFFMLSCYEETINPARDRHDRFPAEASLAKRMNFLHRPIVDEYVEILWGAMLRLWPGLTRKRRVPRTLVSCDVDSPFDPACASLHRLGKRLAGRAWRERSLASLPATIGNYCAVRRGNHARDPYWQALSWVMDVNEKAGNQVTFNFIPEPTDRAMDNAPHVADPRMRRLLRTVHARGHLVGIHPGYNTYRHPEAFARSAAALRRVMDEEHIRQDQLGGRQHYLRWDAAETARLWDENALSYDSTLSYPTVAGFRTGTCHEYTMYDLAERRPLGLRQRPLVVMENAVIDEGNMALGHGAHALAAMQHYKQRCRRFDGDFTLLWHNSSFTDEADKAMYRELIN